METNPVKPDASGVLRDFCAMLAVFALVAGLGLLFATMEGAGQRLADDVADAGANAIEAADAALDVHRFPPDDYDERHCLRTREDWP